MLSFFLVSFNEQHAFLFSLFLFSSSSGFFFIFPSSRERVVHDLPLSSLGTPFSTTQTSPVLPLHAHYSSITFLLFFFFSPYREDDKNLPFLDFFPTFYFKELLFSFFRHQPLSFFFLKCPLLFPRRFGRGAKASAALVESISSFFFFFLFSFSLARK